MMVMPSMRALWSAGKAANKDNTAIYNCSYLTMNSIDSFKELLYILMCGTGVGFNCENYHINKLPRIWPHTIAEGVTFQVVVADSKEGWALALRDVLEHEFIGRNYIVDYSHLRPAGTRLATFGGRSSGPEPLKKLFDYIHLLFTTRRKEGRSLSSLDVHDICCNIAEIVVVGGVRRSSMISLSDLEDDNLRDAKTGTYPIFRAMANNSAVYRERPLYSEFKREWDSLASSGTGERGIYNYAAAMRRIDSSRRGSFEYYDSDRGIPNIGINPCAEILLRDKQFCNLSEVVLRAEDTAETFLQKVKLATVLGVLQSRKTYFPHIRKEWKENCDEEQLLGVSITGQYDNLKISYDENLLTKANLLAKETAILWAGILGSNISAAITCVKPSGTVSQLTNASSGAHPRYADYYYRRYRISATDPLYFLMRDSGFDFSPENGQDDATAQTMVCKFPVKAPDGAVTKDEITAFDQIHHYLSMQRSWTEHNTSMTVYVKEDEWDQVGERVYKNFDDIIALSFLPEEHEYEQAPYEKITKEEYEKAASNFPTIDYERLSYYEQIDQTTGDYSYACMGAACEI